MANIYIQSFKTFFKIGAFTLGGGYAMIPIIEAEVVDKYKWIEKEEFLDLIAIAQSCPGVFAINVSIKYVKSAASHSSPSPFSKFTDSNASSIVQGRLTIPVVS